MQNSLKYKIILLLLFSILLIAKNTIDYTWSIVNMNIDYRAYDRKGKISDSEKSDNKDMIGVNYNIGYILNKKGSYDKINFETVQKSVSIW